MAFLGVSELFLLVFWVDWLVIWMAWFVGVGVEALSWWCGSDCSWGCLPLCLCSCVDVNVLGFALALAVSVLGWSGGGGWGPLVSYNLLSYYAFGLWVVFVGGFGSFFWSSSQVHDVCLV